MLMSNNLYNVIYILNIIKISMNTFYKILITGNLLLCKLYNFILQSLRFYLIKNKDLPYFVNSFLLKSLKINKA